LEIEYVVKGRFLGEREREVFVSFVEHVTYTEEKVSHFDV
jgi:hypothetical protein